MSVILDTSVVIPYLGSAAYDCFVWTRLIREKVYTSSVTSMELLAGSQRKDQRQKAEAFLDFLQRRERIVTPTHGEWLRAGLILARYQKKFGHVDPSAYLGDILILVSAERLGAELMTENGTHLQLWSMFLPAYKRPRLIILDRQDYLNSTRPARLPV